MDIGELDGFMLEAWLDAGPLDDFPLDAGTVEGLPLEAGALECTLDGLALDALLEA